MNALISKFAQACKLDNSLIQKALTTATGVGAALIPENLAKIITDTVIRLSPELYLMTMLSIASKTHEFNRLTARPSRGSAMGENSTTPETQSATVRTSVDLKVHKRKGKVTGFLKDTSREYIDSVAYEMDNELQAQVLDLIYYIYYGNKDAKTIVNAVAEQTPAYEIDGLEQFISTNRIENTVGGVVPTGLIDLDDPIDASNRKGGVRHRRAFVMSPEMLSVYSRLLTNVRLQQPIDGRGMATVDIGGGWRLMHYRNIPIIESTSVTPVETMSATVTLAAEDTGVGGLSDDTYYVYVAPVTYEGEQMPSIVKSQVLNAGTATQRIRITLSAVHQSAAAVQNVLSYKVYLGTATGEANCTLNKIVPAFIYDANGAPTGDNGTGTNYIWIAGTAADASVPAHLATDHPYKSTGGINPESIVLWDLDPIQGLGKMPYTNEAGSAFNGLITTEPLAKTDDFTQFLLKSYCALADSFEATSYWIRNVRKA